MFKVINPATGQVVREYEAHSSEEIEQKLSTAEQVSRDWRQTPFHMRSEALLAVAGLLRERQDRYASLMTEEMGKPIKQAQGEVEKCAWVCEYYAEHASKFLAKRFIDTAEGTSSYVRFDPLGPVLAIMPWNFPFWQVFRFAAPALMAGNVGLLKHAGNVPGTALAIEEIFHDAGFPQGAFTTLLTSSKHMDKVIAHRAVKAVTLTGSERAGKAVASQAGEQIKKTVLELGGSDPFVVLADADIREAAQQAAKSRTNNTGQSCIAAKRFIVEEGVLKEFTDALIAEMESLKVGDPTQADCDMGPLAREDLRDTLHDQVGRSVKAGAKLRCGGEPLEGEGFFYPPTVLDNVDPTMPAFAEETFGPVAAVIRARDADHAIELANRSEYGLGASLWTVNRDRADRLAEQIESGCVFVNEYVKSDPRLPFGGVKLSGYGRELADFGIREFTNIKTVRVSGFKTDVVQEASEESFPASDPPAWTP